MSSRCHLPRGSSLFDLLLSLMVTCLSSLIQKSFGIGGLTAEIWPKLSVEIGLTLQWETNNLFELLKYFHKNFCSKLWHFLFCGIHVYRISHCMIWRAYYHSLFCSFNNHSYMLYQTTMLWNFCFILIYICFQDPSPDHDLSAEHEQILTYISYIGCGISMLGLLLTLVTYSLFR